MNIITNTAELSCNQGTTKSKLTVTSQDFVTIENKPIATEGDNQANVNIMPFGQWLFFIDCCNCLMSAC